MQEINFLHQRRLIFGKHQKQDKRVLIASIVFLVISLVAVGSTLGYNLYLGNQLQQLTARDQKMRQAILDNEQLEVTFLIFSNKLKAIADIFEKRNNKQEAIEYLSTLFGDDISIDAIQYDAKNGVLHINLRNRSVFSLDQLYQKLSSDEVKVKFSTVIKNSLQRKDDGSYSLQVTLGLQKK